MVCLTQTTVGPFVRGIRFDLVTTLAGAVSFTKDRRRGLMMVLYMAGGRVGGNGVPYTGPAARKDFLEVF